MTVPFHQPVVCPILIGRSAELTSLQHCPESAAQGQGSIVLLSGEAGIGKSRLVAELKQSAEVVDFQQLSGQRFPTDRACPYAPLLDLLDTFLAPLSPSQIVTVLGTPARVLFTFLSEQVQHLPELANLSPLPPLDPEQEQRRLFSALTDVFLRVANTKPLLLVIEDLHWSDENTLEFLHFFARKATGHQLLVVLTYRNDEVSQPLRSLLAQFDRERQRQEVILEPLDKADTETVLLTILQGSRSLPDGMLGALYDLTEGNPSSWKRCSKRWSWPGNWSRERMAGAGSVQLVIEESAEQFAFRHALTQQAIASGLLARERLTLHATIARTLEQLYASTLEAHLADLAYHCSEAELWNEAMEYATRAAEQAQALSAPRAAVEQWTRVMYAAEQLGLAVSPTCYRACGQAYELLGDFKQAQADYERTLHIARQLQEGRLEWQSLLDLGFLWTGHDYQRAGVYVQQAVDLARDLSDAGLQAYSLTQQANWLLNTWQVAEALVTNHQALEFFKAQHDQPGMAETFDLLGTVYKQGGDSINAALVYGQAIEYLRATGNRSKLCSCLVMRATVAGPWGGDTCCTINGSLMECGRDLAEALHLARELDWSAGEAFAELFYGGTLASFGQLGVGLVHAQQALNLAIEINHQQWIVRAHEALGRIYLALLAPEHALAHARSGLMAARGLGSASWIVFPHRQAGSSLYCSGSASDG